jgi:hypothetical protein
VEYFKRAALLFQNKLEYLLQLKSFNKRCAELGGPIKLHIDVPPPKIPGALDQ